MTDRDIFLRDVPEDVREDLAFSRWQENNRIGTHSEGCDAWGRSHYECAQRLKELEAQLAAVQKDAERYRWLRMQNWDSAKLCVVESPKTAVKLGYHCPTLHRLDDYIDSAIAGEANEQKSFL